jgi:hypothetical protein
VQHHQYGQSEQRHRHLRSGRGSIYLVEGALDAQRRRQHEQVLVQRLPPCSFETTLPPHPGRTGKWSAGFLQRFQSCTTELLSQLTSISHRHYAKGFICLRLTRHLVDFFGCFDFCFFSAGQGSARGPSIPTWPLTGILCRYLGGRVPPEPFLETYLKRQNPRFFIHIRVSCCERFFDTKSVVRDALRGRSECSTRSLGWWVKVMLSTLKVLRWVA